MANTYVNIQEFLKLSNLNYKDSNFLLTISNYANYRSRYIKWTVFVLLTHVLRDLGKCVRKVLGVVWERKFSRLSVIFQIYAAKVKKKKILSERQTFGL